MTLPCSRDVQMTLPSSRDVKMTFPISRDVQMTFSISRDAQMCARLVPALGLPEIGVPNTRGTSMSLLLFNI